MSRTLALPRALARALALAGAIKRYPDVYTRLFLYFDDLNMPRLSRSVPHPLDDQRMPHTGGRIPGDTLVELFNRVTGHMEHPPVHADFYILALNVAEFYDMFAWDIEDKEEEDDE